MRMPPTRPQSELRIHGLQVSLKRYHVAMRASNEEIYALDLMSSVLRELLCILADWMAAAGC